ncbi:MAG TPA: 30S ribosomal protein S1, partial [Pseudonocardiaceae bacterium]|nr:30S ribosomal protein S1 [Pseudonocardiaceae bacterium]
PDTQEWQEGFDKQREEWERQYAEAHMKQIAKAAEADAEAQGETNYSSGSTEAPSQGGGSLASDEQLAALREKLSGGV